MKQEHAEIVTLRELHEESIVRTSSALEVANPIFSHHVVRVTGTLVGVGAMNRYCWISRKGFDLVVDLAIVDISIEGFKIGCMCQFIGELHSSTDQV